MPSLQDGEACVVGAFPGLHPGLFSFAPSGSGVHEGWAYVSPPFARQTKDEAPSILFL
jgi:hypothetical protein